MSKSKKKLSMTDILRAAIRNSKESVTAIARNAGVPQPVLHRFATGERDSLNLSTAEKLLDYLGFELVQRRKLS